MMTTKKHSNIWTLLFIIAVILGAALQSYVLFNADNSWLLFVTNKLLHGGRYFHDFIEVNPPLILYLYIPPVLIANFLHLNIYHTFTLYIVLISTLIIILCHRILKISDDSDNHLFRYLLVGVLIYLFFYFFPTIMGEREYLTTVLIIPYLLLLNIRVQKKPIRLLMSLSIGLLAGIGFAIKPYFLIPLIFTEIYYIIKTKKLTACFRPEAIVIVLVLVIYLISIFLLTPEYIYQVVPFARKWYYLQYPLTIKHLVSDLPHTFYLVTLLFLFRFYRGSRHQILAEIFFISTIGFTAAYLFGRQPWVYHFFPLYVLLSILMMVLFADLFEKTIKSKNLSSKQMHINAFVLIVMLAAFLLSPVANSVKTTAIYYSNIFQPYNNNVNAFFNNKGKSFANFVSMYTLMVLTKTGYGIPVLRYPNPPYLFEAYNALRSRTHGKKNLEKLHQSKQALINLFVKDIKKHSPTMIIFNYDPKKPNNRQNYPAYPALLKTLLSNKSFKQIWKNYQFVRYVRIVPTNYIAPYVAVFRKSVTSLP